MKKNLMFAVSFLFFISACQPIASSPTPTPKSTETSVPTATTTPKPTATLKPTSTPVPPTPTVAPPSILSTYLTDVRVTEIDNFDTENNWNPYNTQTGKISDGVYVMTGQPNWSSGLQRKNSYCSQWNHRKS